MYYSRYSAQAQQEKRGKYRKKDAAIRCLHTETDRCRTEPGGQENIVINYLRKYVLFTKGAFKSEVLPIMNRLIFISKNREMTKNKIDWFLSKLVDFVTQL